MHRQIRNSVEPDIIGVTNGTFQLELDFSDIGKTNYMQIESLLLNSTASHFLSNQKNVKNLSLNLIKGIPLKKAKLTDIIVFAPYLIGIKYIVSKKFVDCLLDLRVPTDQYELFPTRIKGVSEKFFLFFVPMLETKQIVFSRSLIYPDIEISKKEKSYIRIDSFEQYCEFLNTNPLVSFQRIVLPKKFSFFDILSVQGAGDLFFSEKFLELLKTRGVSSLEITDEVNLKFT